jgi:Tfp pilus assembly protein PilF
MGKSNPKTKITTPKREVSGKVLERVFLPWMAVLALLHLLTMYVTPEYMWGVHFYHFYPVGLGWILIILSLIVLIPGVGEPLYPKFEALAKRIKKPFDTLGQNKSFLILSLLSLPVFWIFRNRLHLLGDGYFRIKDLPEGRLHLQEWLDAFIHLVVYRVMAKPIPSWTPELTYSIFSVLCGGAFVYLALKLSTLLGKTGLGKILIFFSLISLGSIQLFFGYVESYSILQVVLLAYILFSAMYLLRKVSILPALIAFVVSIGLHVTSLVFAPSFIYLLTRKDKDRSRKKGSVAKVRSRPLILAGLILASCLVVFWVYTVATGLEKTGKGIFILPLIATESYSFGMFSLAHVSEFVNQLLLLSPLGMSLIVFFLFFKIKYKDFRDRLVNFLTFATSFALVYLFVFNFTLGSADWDLMSIPAPFIGLLGILLFLRWGEKRSAVHGPPSTDQNRTDVGKPESEKMQATGSGIGKRFGAWGVIFIWFSLFHTVPWIMINAHNQRSLDRYLLIQENDPHPVDETGYNLYKVARILKGAGLEDELLGMYRRAIERDPRDSVSQYNLANWHNRRREFDQAAGILDTLLRIAPAYPDAYWLMGNVHLRKDEPARALPYMEKALPSLQHRVDFLYQLWSAYHSTDRDTQAVACAEKMIRLKPDYVDAYHLLALASIGLGDYQTAKQAWEQVLTIDPNDSRAIKNLRGLENPEK